MGTLNYDHLDRYLDWLEPNAVFVEIGSDRGNGSTPFLADLAARYNTILHTVDVEHLRRSRNDRPNIVWHRGRGSEWADKVWPSIGLKIALLFLDNQDWIYHSDCKSNHLSQQEHLEQIKFLLPWLSSVAVIGCDDTYMTNEHGTWTGKCALGIPLMLAQGFEIKEITWHSGTILARTLDKRSPSL